jgi:hypothetical protein
MFLRLIKEGGGQKVGLLLLCSLVAILYTVGILYSLGIVTDLREMYPGETVWPNLQAASLFRGQFALSHDPRDVRFDLAWSEGGVQQVWGLGIPAWMALLSLLSGLNPLWLPDRFAFAIALFLTAWSTIATVLWLAQRHFSMDRRWGPHFWLLTFPILTIVLFNPAFCTLLKSNFLVYEEVIAYGYLFSLIMAIALLWVCAKASFLRVALLSTLAGLAAFIRPTLGIYGCSAWLFAALLMLRRRVRWRSFFGALSFAPALVLLLLWTNTVRFGAPLEFGHSLNMSNFPGSVYSTRFGYPFSKEPLPSAVKETLGALLFPGNWNGSQWYWPRVFAWQSHTVRWRYNCMPCLGWCFVAAPVGGSMLMLILQFKRKIRLPTEVLVLIGFGLVAFGGLLCFYSYVPVLATRYLYDFAGALVVLAAVVWWCLCNWLLRRGAAGTVVCGAMAFLLCALICVEVSTNSVICNFPVSVGKAVYKENLKAQFEPASNKLKLPADGCSFDPVEGRADVSGVPFDGAGWFSVTGSVAPATIHFADGVRFLEIQATPTSPDADPKCIRAKVGLEFLERTGIVCTNGITEIRFRGPKVKEYQTGVQAVFICWTRKEDLGAGTAPWKLLRLRWR